MNGAPPPPPPGFVAGPSSVPPPPPLPAGWTEHVAPGGQKYWYNAQTNVSTYTRPVPSFVGGPAAGVPPPPPGFPVVVAPAPYAAAAALSPVAPPAEAKAVKKEKKEKPKSKKEIEGTDWVEVETNKGNVFWSNKATKQSVWIQPEEVKEAIRLEKERQEEEARVADRKRKAEEEEKERQENEASERAKKKRKKEKPVVVHEIEELEQDEEFQEKVADQLAQEELEEEQPVLLDEPEEQASSPADDEQRARDQQAAEDAAREQDEQIEKQAVNAGPTITPEEAAAMFKALLSEKDINPMAPWDMELPKFVNDPRYATVKTLKERKDLFDEFCKDKVREQRAAKKAAAAPKVDPATAFRNLLIATVTSTRTHFSDFKRAHGKDPRYRDLQKTDSEKEKIFKNWLRELGERKRNEAKAAEERFVEMLKDDKSIKPEDEWSRVKTRFASDPRYSAVQSSSTRESLFKSHLSTLSSSDTDTKADKAARAAASLREREERVRAEKEKAERMASRAKGALGHEEAEREFLTLLVDAVRDHEARWQDVAHSLSKDPRFAFSLSDHEKRRMFEDHLERLYGKRLAAVEALFAANAPSLPTRFDEVLPKISTDPHVSRLVGDNFDRLEALFDKWNARRHQRARDEFTELLKESPLIEHWVRLQKQDATKEGEDVLENEEEDATGDDPVDVREMARQVDSKAIHASLKHDKRYTQWDHKPEERAQWLEDYIAQLGAPKTTVHQGRA